MIPPGQRGRFGNWLTRVRTDRYKTQGEALSAMKRMGLSIDESTFASWESGGRVPKENNPKVARLYEFFGSTPDDGLGQPVDTADVAAAIREQTVALTRVVESLRERIEASDRRTAQMERLVAVLVQRLALGSIEEFELEAGTQTQPQRSGPSRGGVQ